MPGVGCLKGRLLIADVTNTVLPATTGDDQPRPGTSIAHLTLAVFDHRSGSRAPIARPSMPGPRNPGHSGGGGAAPTAIVRAAPRARRAMAGVCMEAGYRSPRQRRRLDPVPMRSESKLYTTTFTVVISVLSGMRTE